MKSSIPAIVLLVLALSACQDRTSQTTVIDANDATDTMATDPAAPPPMDQPAQDVPPATAPASATLPAGNDSSEQGLVRFDGYGDMRFGMTADEAKQAWGGELIGKTDDPQGCHALTPKWAADSHALAFMFEGGKFVRYDERADKEAAPGGGKVGMGADDIGKLYAGRTTALPHKYVEGGQYLAVADPQGGPGKLVFETDAKGKVTSWRVGVPPQVDYVEGCG